MFSEVAVLKILLYYGKEYKDNSKNSLNEWE